MTPTPPSMPTRGLFLTLDGPDGGGKTTQAARLVAWLRTRGHEVVACREPGGTELGERLRNILTDRATVDLAPRAEMLLFMASRAQLVEEVIRPALSAGRFVVSDRFLLANLVYQGDAGGLPVAEIGEVGRVATGGLLPDLTLVMDVHPRVARARTPRPRDRSVAPPGPGQGRARDASLRAARAGGIPDYPAPVVEADAWGDPDAVFERIRSEV